MEVLAKDAILEFHSNTLDEVRKMYNFDKPGDMAAAVDIFDTWVKQQNHFNKKDFSREFLERMIINCKGSIERAKARLDKLCTMRTMTPEFFGIYDIQQYFKHVADGNVFYAPMPKLTDKNERVFFIKNAAKKMTTEMIMDGFKLCALMCEYMKAHDYAASYMFVVDIRECNISEFLKKVGLVDFRNLMTIITEGYGFRLTGIHILHNLPMVDAVLFLLRSVMSEKVGGRIKFHKAVEDVYEFAPKEILPKEYGEGGENRSLVEINKKWMEALSSEAFSLYLKEMNSASTDEKYRQTDTFNDKYMGMPGTFRALKVD